MTHTPSTSRRSVLQKGLCSLALPVLSDIGLFGIAACKAETSAEGNQSGPSNARADYALLQGKLNDGGTVLLDRVYYIPTTLYVSGNTQVRGRGGAKLVWVGSPNQSILKDTSLRDSSIRNDNILLEDFEIDGGNLATGSKDQLAIEFYRTRNITIRRLTVHGVGGSGIRWGNSFIDTINVVVENCTIYDCRVGDALQGSGRQIVLRNNVIGTQTSRSSFGDTGIALLMDFDRKTNPDSLFSNQVKILGNQILGNYRDTGFTGVGGRMQTGIACGPFSVGFSSDITIQDNIISGCYVNIWLTSMSNITIGDNTLKKHYSNLTGNLRLDNVSNVHIYKNKIDVSYPSNNSGACAILLHSRRSIYGNSVFEGKISDISIENNIINGIKSCGIRMEFGEINIHPHYISRIDNVVVSGNNFYGVKNPVFLAPVTGETLKTFTGLTVEDNISDNQTSDFITMLGRKSQYSQIKIRKNSLPNGATLMSGTGTRID